MPPKVAAAIQALGSCEARHLVDHLPRGTPDEDVFAFLASKDWLLLTQDENIRRKPHQRQALLEAGIGAFILTGRAQKSVEEMMIFLLSRLGGIETLATSTKRPFIFGIPDRGKIDKLE